MEKYGEYSVIQRGYQRYKSDIESDDRKYKAKAVVEYIHILKKEDKNPNQIIFFFLEEFSFYFITLQNHLLTEKIAQ